MTVGSRMRFRSNRRVLYDKRLRMRQACSMIEAEAYVQEGVHAHETGVLDESEACTCLAIGRESDERRSMGKPTGMLVETKCARMRAATCERSRVGWLRLVMEEVEAS